MAEYMSYEEYLVKVREGIVTERGNCPVTPLLRKLQGKWKTQILYELCMRDSVRFGELRKALPEITSSTLSNTLKELKTTALSAANSLMKSRPMWNTPSPTKDAIYSPYSTRLWYGGSSMRTIETPAQIVTLWLY